MRLTIAATLVALSSAAFGWDITVYKDLFCNENDVGNFEYYIFEGEGDMPYCAGISAKDFPDGVTCTHYYEGGAKNDACNGQFDKGMSLNVRRGRVTFYTVYDDDSAQPDDKRCPAGDGLLDGFPNDSGSVGFTPTTPGGCVNMDKKNDYHYPGVMGFWALEGPPVGN